MWLPENALANNKNLRASMHRPSLVGTSAMAGLGMKLTPAMFSPYSPICLAMVPSFNYSFNCFGQEASAPKVSAAPAKTKRF